MIEGCLCSLEQKSVDVGDVDVEYNSSVGSKIDCNACDDHKFVGDFDAYNMQDIYWSV